MWEHCRCVCRVERKHMRPKSEQVKAGGKKRGMGHARVLQVKARSLDLIQRILWIRILFKEEQEAFGMFQEMSDVIQFTYSHVLSRLWVLCSRGDRYRGKREGVELLIWTSNPGPSAFNTLPSMLYCFTSSLLIREKMWTMIKGKTRL